MVILKCQLSQASGSACLQEAACFRQLMPVFIDLQCEIMKVDLFLLFLGWGFKLSCGK